MQRINLLKHNKKTPFSIPLPNFKMKICLCPHLKCKLAMRVESLRLYTGTHIHVFVILPG